ncbi:pggt1b [Trichonephila clavipes]|nr:pggt1b [Trichonephila clavipes]
MKLHILLNSKFLTCVSSKGTISYSNLFLNTPRFHYINPTLATYSKSTLAPSSFNASSPTTAVNIFIRPSTLMVLFRADYVGCGVVIEGSNALENYTIAAIQWYVQWCDITSGLYSKGFDIVFCWLPSHVGIIGNEQADSAAKSATTHLPLAVPLSDMKRVIMHHIFKIWEEESWSQQLDNKLHSVKPCHRSMACDANAKN